MFLLLQISNFMDLLSNRINALSESGTIEMATKARELKYQGKDIISLSLGEPDFDTPDHIKEAAKKALDDGFTKYTPVPGFLDLRESISIKFIFWFCVSLDCHRNNCASERCKRGLG